MHGFWGSPPKGGSIDLGLIERVNKEGLRAVMVSPIRVPPLYINLPVFIR